MHIEPDEMAEVDSQAIYGTQVEVIQKKRNWIHIRTPDQYSGWVQETCIETTNQTYPSTSNIAQVKTLFAHVYWVDDTSSHPPIITLPFESKVEVSQTETFCERWIHVRLLDGKLGWMQRGDLIFNPTTLAIEEMLVLSKQFIGLPYTWGGTSSYGFDCSGFVQMLYRQMGILLPRNASLQVNTSGALIVELSQLEPGDLIFFGPKQEKITHVGMYLGDGRFIHTKANLTSGPPTVQISRLDTPTWPEKTICARRVVHLK